MKTIIGIIKGIGNIIKELFKDPIGRIGLIGVAIVVLLSIFAPKIAPFDITEMFTKNKLAAPNSEFIFGTDNFGRDVFSRIIYGASWNNICRHFCYLWIYTRHGCRIF